MREEQLLYINSASTSLSQTFTRYVTVFARDVVSKLC